VICALYKQGTKPTVNALERDRAEISGVKTAWAEAADNPKLFGVDSVLPNGEGAKLLAFRVALNRRGIFE
jgi:hypothetical protein